MPVITTVSGKAVVQLEATEETSANGLFIPEAAREQPTIAVVVFSAIDSVASGDKVILSGPYAGAAFTVEGVEYITVVPDEILGVIE